MKVAFVTPVVLVGTVIASFLIGCAAPSGHAENQTLETSEITEKLAKMSDGSFLRIIAGNEKGLEPEVFFLKNIGSSSYVPCKVRGFAVFEEERQDGILVTKQELKKSGRFAFYEPYFMFHVPRGSVKF